MSSPATAASQHRRPAGVLRGVFVLAVVSLVPLSCAKSPATRQPLTEPRASGPTESAAGFSEHLPEALCEAFLSCRNQEVQQAALIQGMFSMATASKHAAQIVDTEIQPALADLPSGWVETKADCLPVARALAKGFGYGVGIVRPKTGVGLVEFDSGAASVCLESIKNTPAECAEELRLSDPGTVSEGGRPYATEAYFAPTFAGCGAVISGTLQPGETCEYDYECEGERARCSVVDEVCYRQ